MFKAPYYSGNLHAPESAHGMTTKLVKCNAHLMQQHTTCVGGTAKNLISIFKILKTCIIIDQIGFLSLRGAVGKKGVGQILKARHQGYQFLAISNSRDC